MHPSQDPHDSSARRTAPSIPSWRSTWPSPRHAVGLAHQVTAGWRGRSCRLPIVGAWRQLMNNPHQNRYSRRIARRRAAVERVVFGAGITAYELGPRSGALADTAVMTAIMHGYDRDTLRVGATLRALLDQAEAETP